MRNYTVLMLFLLIAAPSVSWACAGCESTAVVDGEESEHAHHSIDIRYSSSNQNQLRSGTSTITPSAASQMVVAGKKQEVFSYTKNQYITASGEFGLSSIWKLGIEIPFVMRKHGTLGTASNGTTAGAGGGQYNSSTSNLGDSKLIARYLGLTAQHHFGLIAGLKLPTGSKTKKGNSTDATAPDPVSIDRALQPGTGTYDAIVGAFDGFSLGKGWDYFCEGTYQVPLKQSAQFREGNELHLSLGTKYTHFHSVIPQIQANLLYVKPDVGASADTINTGGTLLYLSPGLSVALVEDLRVYSVVQIPIYQKYQGVQLAAKYIASVGVSYAF